MFVKQPVSIELNLKSNSKLTLLETLCQSFWEAGKLYNRDLFLEEVLKREALLSTYCGKGVAIPHAASAAVKEPSFIFARCTEINWDEEESPVQFIILLAIPEVAEGEESPHIEMMSEIATLALDEEIRAVWASARDKEIILKTFN
jgi:PTS system fructose-specific IIC component